MMKAIDGRARRPCIAASPSGAIMSASLRSWAALFAAILAIAVQGSATPLAQAQQSSTQSLLAEFERYSGTRLVFRAADLPDDGYHDIMLPLSASGRQRAAEICLREVKKYPPGFLGSMGLQAIGVFAGCASRQGDGYRAYDEQLGGYRYYGIWNGQSGIAAAHYSDSQLPLTFHHEIFHHIDGTHGGRCDASRYFTSDDRQFALAIAGQQRYAPLRIGASELNALRQLAQGNGKRAGRLCQRVFGQSRGRRSGGNRAALHDVAARRPRADGGAAGIGRQPADAALPVAIPTVHQERPGRGVVCERRVGPQC
jgi:hypothetical protein